MPSTSSLKQKVTLEPVGPQHAAVIQRLASAPEITANTLLPEPYPPDGAELWISYVEPRHASGREYAFAVIGDAEEVVGVCGLVPSSDSSEAEMGYWIGVPFWGRGYASEACRLLLRLAFRGLIGERVMALPLAANTASRRVLERLNFRYTGTVPSPYAKWPSSVDMARYEITRVEWLAQQASGKQSTGVEGEGGAKQKHDAR